MTQILTVRVSPDLIAKADERAAELGLDRGKYVRGLIEQDLNAARKQRRKHKFASDDFIGSAESSHGPYTNSRVRAVVRKKLTAKRG